MRHGNEGSEFCYTSQGVNTQDPRMFDCSVKCTVASSARGIKTTVDGMLDPPTDLLWSSFELLLGHPALEVMMRGLEDLTHCDGRSVRIRTSPDLNGLPEWWKLWQVDVDARQGWGRCCGVEVCGVQRAEVATFPFPPW